MSDDAIKKEKKLFTQKKRTRTLYIRFAFSRSFFETCVLTRALITSVEKSRVSRAKIFDFRTLHSARKERRFFLSLFLLVNFCCYYIGKKRDLKNAGFHVGAQPVRV